MQTGPWVLILDDDTAFSAFLADLLTSAGLSTYQAATCTEATEVIERSTPALAIVDYQLVESNGINWLTTARESGHKFPVILLSGTWHDERSFHRLRNVLQISMFLRKPIDPNTFMAEIGYLCPIPAVATVPTDFKEIEHQIESSGVGWSPYNRAQMRHPEELQLALRRARIDFAKQLPSRASGLIEAIKALKIEPGRQELLFTANNEAHRLAGSAGSFGFQSVGQVAEKVSGLLHNLELDTSTMSDLVWSELIRTLTLLETHAQKALMEVSDDAVPSIDIDRKKIVLMSDDTTCEIIRGYSTNLEVLTANDAGTAIEFAKENSLQSLTIDLAVCPMSTALEIARVFRLTTGHEGLEINVIVDNVHSFSNAELLYMGCSNLVVKPIHTEPTDLVQCRPNFARHKVLLVDDDPAITEFIGTLLSARGMTVNSLNEPTRILNCVEQFQPDLILLDVIMPGLSGYDICRLLRATEGWSTIPIIFLTSKTDSESRRLAFQAGGSDFLAKPIVSEELVARVKLHLPPRLQQPAGLLSRIELEKMMEKVFIEATSKKQLVTFALIQLDRIDSIRDVCGIAATDLALSQIGRTLQSRFRSCEVKGQLADLFVVVFPNAEASVVESALDLLANEVNQLQIGFNQVPSISYGVAQLPRDTNHGTELLSIALGRLRSAQQANT